MTIETTVNEVVLRIPTTLPKDQLQEIIDFARYKELTSKFKVSQDVADQLAEEVNEQWWKENRDAFLK